MGITREEVQAALEATVAVGQAIKELSPVPSGHMYANLMGTITLDQYDQIIKTLIRCGIVKLDCGVLYYIDKGHDA